MYNMLFFNMLVILCVFFQMSSILQCSIINLKSGLFWLEFSDCYTVDEISELVSAQVVAVQGEELM